MTKADTQGHDADEIRHLNWGITDLGGSIAQLAKFVFPQAQTVLSLPSAKV